jgi:hypothetical protein
MLIVTGMELQILKKLLMKQIQMMYVLTEPTSQAILNVTDAWNNADCDGDGITNEKENTDWH